MHQHKSFNINQLQCQITLCTVDLVNQTRKDMTILNVEVIMGTKNISRNHRCELASILLVVSSTSI